MHVLYYVTLDKNKGLHFYLERGFLMNNRCQWNDITKHVLECVKENQLFSVGDTVVVAVSGGPDSVVLLHVLHHISCHEIPIKLVCAHVNHGLRQQSEAEMDFVRRLSTNNHIPFESIVLDGVRDFYKVKKGIQEAARTKRYAFLHAVASKYRANSIALGHHADDQAETILLHILRGSGLSGLTGIKMKRVEKKVTIIRPLLRIHKKTLLEVCDACSFSFVEDSTNKQRKYKRNEIRLELIPFLEQYNQQIVSSLNTLAEIATHEEEWFERHVLQIFNDIVNVIQQEKVTFSVLSVCQLHISLQRRLIKLILDYMFREKDSVVNFYKIERIRRMVTHTSSTTAQFHLGHGLVCVREYDLITLQFHTELVCNDYKYELQMMQNGAQLYVDATQMLIRMNLMDITMISHTPSDNEAWFDAALLSFPLTVRARVPGDKMSVIGLNGTKKVKDIFIDAKVPPSARERIPIVCDAQGNIIWLPGVRRSNVALVHQHTSSVILLNVEHRSDF